MNKFFGCLKKSIHWIIINLAIWLKKSIHWIIINLTGWLKKSKFWFVSNLNRKLLGNSRILYKLHFRSSLLIISIICALITLFHMSKIDDMLGDNLPSYIIIILAFVSLTSAIFYETIRFNYKEATIENESLDIKSTILSDSSTSNEFWMETISERDLLLNTRKPILEAFMKDSMDETLDNWNKIDEKSSGEIIITTITNNGPHSIVVMTMNKKVQTIYPMNSISIISRPYKTYIKIRKNTKNSIWWRYDGL